MRGERAPREPPPSCVARFVGAVSSMENYENLGTIGEGYAGLCGARAVGVVAAD